MNSASPCRPPRNPGCPRAGMKNNRGNVFVLTLVLVAMMTALALAGLERTRYQSQLAAGLARQTLLRTEATRALAAARYAEMDRLALAFTPECPPRCDWRHARRVAAAEGVTAAYVVHRFTPSTTRFLVAARATHVNGGAVVAHALFDSRVGAFRFIR